MKTCEDMSVKTCRYVPKKTHAVVNHTVKELGLWGKNRVKGRALMT